MTISEYAVAVADSIVEYRKNAVEDALFEHDDPAEALRDEFWADDDITGNASGSFFCDRWKAYEALGEDLSDICAALVDAGYSDYESIGRMVCEADFESLDVMARCLVLPDAIQLALERLSVAE